MRVYKFLTLFMWNLQCQKLFIKINILTWAWVVRKTPTVSFYPNFLYEILGKLIYNYFGLLKFRYCFLEVFYLISICILQTENIEFFDYNQYSSKQFMWTFFFELRIIFVIFIFSKCNKWCMTIYSKILRASVFICIFYITFNNYEQP